MHLEESSENHRLIDATLDGRYSVDRLLHQGRRNDLFMGQEGLDETARAVVLKVPHRLTNESAMMVAREAGFLTNIDHPNVVRSFDVGSDDHDAFLVLEPIVAHRYMAPEQHRGEETGPWVDVFAIGMMLHAALVGELAEPGERLLDKRAVSAELDEVVAIALAPEPADRFLSALGFQDALTRAILIG